jgi:hypothetical protein
MMTPDEGYAEAMSLVEELKNMGIRVEVVNWLARSKDRPDYIAEMKAKYNGPDRVAPEKWVNVHFYPISDEQSAAVRDRQRKLGWLGIGFDSGGMAGQRDWEMDWSFRVTERPATTCCS